MRTSERTDEIATSLFAMRKELKQPTADQVADAGSYSYPYLSLPALVEFIDSKIMSLSLSYAQEVTRDGDGVGVTTRIMHSSGQWLELGPLFLPVKGNAQAWGSAISYGRRYALAAAFGIAPRGEDDDGASADLEPRTVTRTTAAGMGDAERGGEGEAFGEGAAPEPPQLEVPAEVLATQGTATTSQSVPGVHPGMDHKLKPSKNVEGARYCIITTPAGKCDFVTFLQEAKA